MRKTIIAVALAAVTLLSGCKGFGFNPPIVRGTTPKARVDITLTPVQQEMLTATNSLAFKLLCQIDTRDSLKSYLFSPLSMSVALAMTANGAEGQTADQIKSVLGLGGYTDEAMNAYFKTLMSQLYDVDNTVIFSSANSLWLNSSYGVLTTYVELLKSEYGAVASTLDFSDEASVEVINKWCAEKTDGKISKLVNKLSPSAVMILMNAIYFNGLWKDGYGFDESKTAVETFYNEQGTALCQVDMMHNRAGYAIAFHDVGFSAVALPYGNSAFEMDILLPDDGHCVEEIIGTMNRLDKWKKLTDSFSSDYDVDLSLPRFKFKFNETYNDILSALGMPDAFSSAAADFSRIRAEKDIHIDAVNQAAYIDVNEQGTEAAAITDVSLDTSYGDKPQTCTFRIDRPFIFVIREISTGVIIFMGKVMNLAQ